MDPSAACLTEGESQIPEWLGHGGYIPLFLALILSFAGLAIVVEEYFVPALNILCDDMSLPDDIAGATIMAIGNSSPELFSCIISLFVTHTALGVGTAIGSAIFNHLCICAGSIFYADKFTLQLDWRILSRESLVYLSSLIILVWSLKGNDFGISFQTAFDGIGRDPTQCLVVRWYQALALFGGYIFYIIICVIFSPLVACICPLSPQIEDEEAEESSNKAEGTEPSPGLNTTSTYQQDVIELPRKRSSFFGSSSKLPINEKVSLVVNTSKASVIVPGSDVPLPSEIIEVPRHRTSFFGSSINLYTRRSDQPLDQMQLALSGSDHNNDHVANLENESVTNEDRKTPARPRARTRTSSDEGNAIISVPRIDSSYIFSQTFPQVQSSQIRSTISDSDLKYPESLSPSRKLSISAVEMVPITETDIEKDIEASRPVNDSIAQSAIHMDHHPRYNFDHYRPEDLVQLPTSEPTQFPRFEGWMYKRSRFYSRHRMLSNQKWDLRFFIFDELGLRHCNEDPRKSTTKHIQKTLLNIFEATDVFITDPNKFEFVILAKGVKFRFRCLNIQDLHAVVKSIREHIDLMSPLTAAERKNLSDVADSKQQAIELQVVSDGAHHNILSTPESLYSRWFHYFLYPMKLAIYYTVPEITHSGEHDENSKAYWWTILSSIFWLAALSYLMNYSLEEFGLLFRISSGALGLTFGASGTSVPNLLSSMIVARQGLGDMAVSNAFGSNIFCIYFVLGFSWTIYVFVHGQPYDLLPDDGLVLLVIFLLAAMIIFTLMVLASKFVLKFWMGILFVLAYAAFVGFAFALN
jgi:Ca2+/Na+ antiporter